MAKTIRKLLGEAYKFIGLAPNGILHDGQVDDGVTFANEVIRKYNESSLFPFTFVTLEATVSGGSLVITIDGSEGVQGDVPAGISSLYWKRSQTDMYDLDKCKYSEIFNKRNTSSSPMWFALVPESDDKAVVHFDALGTFNVLIVYPKNLQELKIDDVFAAPAIYEQVVKYGVAVRAAAKASLEDSVIANYQKLLDDAVDSIITSNAGNRPIQKRHGGFYSRHEIFDNPRWR